VDLVAFYLLLPFLLLLALGVPIAFSISLACALFLLFSGTRIPTTVLASEMYGAVDSFTLLALPTFVLAGELLNRCELTDKLIEFCQRLVGWIRGGLAHVTVTASMLLLIFTLTRHPGGLGEVLRPFGSWLRAALRRRPAPAAAPAPESPARRCRMPRPSRRS